MPTKSSRAASGFGRPWCALTVAFALHLFDEATRGFLNVYNPTVIATRERWGSASQAEVSPRVAVGIASRCRVVLCFCPDSGRDAGGTVAARPARRALSGDHFFHAMGRPVGTILGHTVVSLTFARPAPGLYSSPLLVISSVWWMMRLWKTAARAPVPASA